MSDLGAPSPLCYTESRKTAMVEKGGHRLNMEVDLQSLFGLHVTWCAQLYSLGETMQLLPSPRNVDSYYEGAFGQPR